MAEDFVVKLLSQSCNAACAEAPFLLFRECGVSEPRSGVPQSSDLRLRNHDAVRIPIPLAHLHLHVVIIQRLDELIAQPFLRLLLIPYPLPLL